MKPIGRLHVLTDCRLQQRWTHRQLAEQAVAGGADVVQFRDKRPLPAQEAADLVAELETVVTPPAQLVLNDRVALARQTNCGAHVGRRDMPVLEARRLLGSGALLGATANSMQEVEFLAQQAIDYVGVGPVFATRSKENPAPVLGLGGFALIVQHCKVPVIAIGGIRPEHVGDLMAAGAHGVAVLSGIACDAEPREATRRYAEAIRLAIEAHV